MYKIEKRPSGFILTFSGVLDLAEIKQWYSESEVLLREMKRSNQQYGVIVNMTQAKTWSPEVNAILGEGQKMYRESGMLRSAVILQNEMVKVQVKVTSIKSGINKTERYFNGEDKDAVAKAIDWVKNGVEPVEV